MNAAKRTQSDQSSPDFEALWNTIPSPALAVGADNEILRANPAAELFFSLSAAQLARRCLEDLAGPTSPLADLAAQARRGALSVSAFGVTLDAAEVEAGSFGGASAEARVVDIQAAPVLGPAGLARDGCLLVVVHPRSVATQMGEAVVGRGASRSLSGLSATLAHEIKNPLFGISGAVQLMENHLDAADRELAKLIHEEIERIRALLDRMDAFGELGPVERRAVNIHGVLDQARRSAAAGFGRHARFFEFYDPSLPPVPGDRAQLLQAVSNLIKNAVEAAPSNGAEIHLRTGYRSGVKIAAAGGAQARLPLEIVVADNGPGVPETLRPHVFEPFVTSKGKGTGLGLALVAKIISDHGGVIDYRRRRGRTEFRILLPVWEGPAPAEEEDAAQAPAFRSGAAELFTATRPASAGAGRGRGAPSSEETPA